MEKNEIIVKHKNGQSKSSIARELGISRNTVKRYLREYEESLAQLSQETDRAMISLIQEAMCSKPVRRQSEKKKTAFTSEVEQRFIEIIQIDDERNKVLGINKQQLTGSLIYRTLLSEGFKIGETTIRAKYREYKNKNKECFIKQSYEYGNIAQFDFHQVKVILNGEKQIYHQATISIPKSNIVFGMLFKNEKMESFIQSLVQFFKFCGGVFNKIVFDNMSTAVKRFCFKGEKEYTDDIIKISNYYGFEIETCNPRRGNEKGHVENSGKVIRRDFFCLKYKFDSVEELYSYYEHELFKRNQPYQEAFKEEQKHLKSLPVHPYELGRLQYAKANSFSLISIDGNFYSIPDKYVEKKVTCNIYDSNIIIYDDKNNLIAKHAKKDGKGEYSINIHHYIDTLLKKPKALKNSYAIKQAPEFLQSIYNQHFTTKPKEFLLLLKENDTFLDELNKLKINIGKSDRIQPDSLFDSFNEPNEVDIISIKQLNHTSLLFGQEV